jgi:hypothetical protein
MTAEKALPNTSMELAGLPDSGHHLPDAMGVMGQFGVDVGDSGLHFS